MPMLRDRKIDFSESKKDEWEIIRTKIGNGMELPDPDSERWFLSTVEIDGIRISTAEKNVRPLVIHNPMLIEFEEFQKVANIYNDSLFGGVEAMSPKLEVQKTCLNMKYIFNLIYNLL